MSPWLVNWLSMTLSNSWPPLLSYSINKARQCISTAISWLFKVSVKMENQLWTYKTYQLRFANNLVNFRHFSSCFQTLSAKTLLWPDIFFASTEKEGNTWWWDSPHDLQRPRGSTCSLTAWLAFTLNLNIHFGFPGMLVLRHSGKRSSNSQTLKNQISSDMAPRKQRPAVVIKAADIWFSSFYI